MCSSSAGLPLSAASTSCSAVASPAPRVRGVELRRTKEGTGVSCPVLVLLPNSDSAGAGLDRGVECGLRDGAGASTTSGRGGVNLQQQQQMVAVRDL